MYELRYNYKTVLTTLSFACGTDEASVVSKIIKTSISFR